MSAMRHLGQYIWTAPGKAPHAVHVYSLAVPGTSQDRLYRWSVVAGRYFPLRRSVFESQMVPVEGGGRP
jgi:hypothetical protein